MTGVQTCALPISLLPSNKLKLQLQLQLLNQPSEEDIVEIEKILWDGAFLWKIPFNGKGMPERRIVSVKRAAYASIYSKAVRIKSEETSMNVLNGTNSVVGYIVYPPTLIWYDSDKLGEIKNARELILVEGAHVVAGHSTPAFWKLSNRDGPTPRPDLCFSIVTNVRTLDLAAETCKSSGEWKKALHSLLVSMSTNTNQGMNSSPISIQISV